MNTPTPTEESARSALRSVIDPEIGMNIVDLGLIYGVTIKDTVISVDLTMTTQACPMGDMILDDARQALKTIAPENFTIELNLVWEPPWSPTMMTEYARRCLGWDDSPDHLV